MKHTVLTRNKILALLLFVGATLFVGGFFSHTVEAAKLPASPGTFYYDQTNLLSEETKQLVTNKNENYEQTGKKPQVIMAVVKSTGDVTIDEYASDLFDKWNIGQKDSDNGILILYANNDGKRNVRIEVGYGLEGAVTDAQAGSILRSNAQLLKSANKSKVNEGLQQTFNAVVTLVDKEYGYKLDKNSLTDEELQKVENPNKRDLPSALIIGFLIFVGISIFASFRGRGGKGGPKGPGGIDSSFPWWLMLLGSDNDDDHWGGGGFGGGGGFSGGGGSSGGGGASI